MTKSNVGRVSLSLCAVPWREGKGKTNVMEADSLEAEMNLAMDRGDMDRLEELFRQGMDSGDRARAERALGEEGDGKSKEKEEKEKEEKEKEKKEKEKEKREKEKEDSLPSLWHGGAATPIDAAAPPGLTGSISEDGTSEGASDSAVASWDGVTGAQLEAVVRNCLDIALAPRSDPEAGAVPGAMETEPRDEEDDLGEVCHRIRPIPLPFAVHSPVSHPLPVFLARALLDRDGDDAAFAL